MSSETVQSGISAFEAAKAKVEELAEVEDGANLSRKERERFRNRQEIMDAAMALFCEHGFAQVTMQEIAAKAEFGTGTLYKYFKSKQELYATIVLERAYMISSEFDELFDRGLEPEALLCLYIYAYRRIFRSHTKYVLLFHTISNALGASGNEALDTEMARIVQRGRARLAAVVQDGIDRGVFRNVDAMGASEMLVSLLDAGTRKVVHEGIEHDDDLKTIEDIFMTGLLAEK